MACHDYCEMANRVAEKAVTCAIPSADNLPNNESLHNATANAAESDSLNTPYRPTGVNLNDATGIALPLPSYRGISATSSSRSRENDVTRLGVGDLPQQNDGFNSMAIPDDGHERCTLDERDRDNGTPTSKGRRRECGELCDDTVITDHVEQSPLTKRNYASAQNGTEMEGYVSRKPRLVVQSNAPSKRRSTEMKSDEGIHSGRNTFTEYRLSIGHANKGNQLGENSGNITNNRTNGLVHKSEKLKRCASEPSYGAGHPVRPSRFASLSLSLRSFVRRMSVAHMNSSNAGHNASAAASAPPVTASMAQKRWPFEGSLSATLPMIDASPQPDWRP